MKRKRTNKNIPAKSALLKKADRLWSVAVRGDWAWKCAAGGHGKCEAHHVIPRQHEATRYALRNGIALNTWHHKFDPDMSPHQNAVGWLKWLSEHYPELHQWYLETTESGEHKRFSGTKNTSYYIGVIRRLKQHVPAEDFERIVGIRFSRWLEEEGEK